MRRFITIVFAACVSILVHAELKVHFTFETLNSTTGNHTGSLQQGATLTTFSDLPVLSLGTDNGYFDMGASVGDVISTLDEFIISTNVYIPNSTSLSGNGNFIYTFSNSSDIASDRNGCIFFGARRMRYAITPFRWEDEEGIQTGTSFPTGQWHNLTYIQNATQAALYLDGERIAEDDAPMAPSELGATPYNFLGRPCYASDAYLKNAYYHDFRIYDNADDIRVDELTHNLDQLNRDIDEALINTLISTFTLGETTITDDINLPTSTHDGVTITWASSDANVISTTGIVTRPSYDSGDAEVTLTATFSKGSISKQKTLQVSVPAFEMDDYSIVTADYQAISLKGHLDNLTCNLYLPQKGDNGSTIEWTSSHPSVIDNQGQLLHQSSSTTTQVQLTATISLRDVIVSRTFDITVAKKMQYAYYLFAYFNGNAQWQEQICFALSKDGYNYTPLNDGNPIINSADIALKEAVRDPHILRGEDGYFYMVVTDMRSSDGWSSNDGMVLLRSADMINWTHTAIDFPTRWPERFDRNTLTQVWAPQTIYDPEEGKYMVYYAIGESGKNYITYYSYANEDFTDLTEPQVLYNHNGMNTIDADIVWHDGLYHMFFKTEGQGNGIQKATAKRLRGEWTPEYKYLQQTNLAVEGSGVFKLIDSDRWVLMYDCYTNNMYEYCTSTDLSNFTKECNSVNTEIFTPRHGTTITITAEEAKRLIGQWPSEGLSLAPHWTDITATHLENPNFNSNSSNGWTYTSNASNINLSYGAMEFWNGQFDINQSIQVPNGKYRISAQAFYYTSGEESAFLYANEVMQPIVARNSEGVEYDNSGQCDNIEIDGISLYIPKNMQSGAYCFEQGIYNNSVEIEVTDGTLTLGLMCNEYTEKNWCMLDNFRIEYLGDYTPIEAIQLSHQTITMNENQSFALTANILPENTINYGISWYSENEAIASVDQNGVVRAHQEGTTRIVAQSADANRTTSTCNVTVTTLEGTWSDVTDAYIVNPDFGDGTYQGWTIGRYAENTKTEYGCMEFWNGTFDIHQNLRVANGKYRISVLAYYRTGENNQSHNAYINGNENITAYLYANDNTQPIASVYSEYLNSPVKNGYYRYIDSNYSYYYYPNSMEFGAYCFEQGMYHNSITVDVTDQTLTFGISSASSRYSNWCMMDNFRLEYYGTLTPVSSITLSQSALSLRNGESATLTTSILPSNATCLNIRWHSDNPTIADVDQYGTITAYQGGTATIYAEATDNSGVSATCTVSVTSIAPTSDHIIINEIQSANIDMFVDPSFNYGGWVELYNPTDQNVSLSYLYVSDDPNNLTKYQLGRDRGVIPAKGYHVLWFDHHNNQFLSQIDFKLDYDGGTFYISDYNGQLITSQDYPMAIPRTSYARITDGAEEWGYTATPTPAANNRTSTFATERVEAPIVDTDACLFTSPFTISVQIPDGTTLRYTTDGSTPTLTNGSTSEDGVFDVEYTTTYRFCLFEEGKLPSQVITRSYIYQDNDYMLPVISVVTDPVNLYDNTLGVYIKGTNGRTGNGQSSPCNWNMDWDRPVNFEYIAPEEGMVVNQEVDFAMCGGWSRAYTPHSFKLKASKIYEGLNSIDYPFFADKPYLKHKTLQMRNGGNDTDCRIKDAALQAIVHSSGLDVDGQSTQPIMHFINGEYKGMLNMREPNNKHNAYANWGLDSDEMDQFEMSPDSGYVQMEGTRDAFLEWYELSKDAADETTYEEIRNLVDIDEYINYLAIEFYLGGLDWPQNNIKGFRPRTDGGRFRFVLFDLDGALNTTNSFSKFEEKQTWTFDYIYDMGGRFTEEIEFVTIFLNMLTNDTFRKQFIDTYCLVAGSVFEPERSIAIINDMAARIAPALALENKSPYNTANSLKSSLTNRQGTMINALVNYSRMGLDDDMRQNISISSNIDGAMLRLNDMAIPTNKFAGTLFSPITLKAEPKAGYKFVGWSARGGTNSGNTLIGRGSSWQYYDSGSLDGYNWKSKSYSASSWSQGNAPLGYFTTDTYNERGYNTILDYGSSTNAKRPTYYFRTSFNLSQAPATDDQFILNYTVDDGMVVYVNGVEAGRYLMPEGDISYSTYATTYASGNPDNGSLMIDPSLLVQGTNVIAVEVHNNSGSSSDIYFDADLVQITTNETIVSSNAEYTLPSQTDMVLTALYEPFTDAEQKEMGLQPVRINEISADNSIYINEYYKKNDWIELYNTTSEPIDVAGMYLSDNLDKLTKYEITGTNGVNTIIDPYSYLIVWADKLITITQLHAPFKLSTDGGYVALTAADQSWSDILYYEPHLGTESVGLYPDGSSNVYVMTTPTIAQANMINSYTAWLEQPDISNSETGTLLSEDNDMWLQYIDNHLHIYCDEASLVNIKVYTTTGRICMNATAQFNDGHATINLTSLDEGIYIVSATTSNRNTQTIKLNVK